MHGFAESEPLRFRGTIRSGVRNTYLRLRQKSLDMSRGRLLVWLGCVPRAHAIASSNLAGPIPIISLRIPVLKGEVLENE
jgi:hypothetical protein